MEKATEPHKFRQKERDDDRDCGLHCQQKSYYRHVGFALKEYGIAYLLCA